MNALPTWLDEGWQHIWLPYTQMQTASKPLPVVGAEGCEIKLADGRTLVDGVAAWWSTCHGYQHPQIVEAIRQQADTLSHIMFAGLAHESAYTLAARLAKMAPGDLNHVFFTDSGSTSVEVALKMAIQYWYNKGKARKSKFICFNNAYHGDTFGAMSVSARDGMHKIFSSITHKHYIMDIPSDEYSVAEFEEMVAGIAPTAAGLIIEPLVQGAGGMRFYSADVLAEIRRVCREHELLFIADEIMTGFARTGSMFACEEAGITPDIMCTGKGLTGGHISLAATLASDEVFAAFQSDKLGDALMHGPTFMANPLACAAANASLDLFETEPRIAQVDAIDAKLSAELANCHDIEGVKDVRVRGAIGVVQIDATQDDMFILRNKFIDLGVWLRPFSDIVYIMPPLVISEKQLTQITNAVQDVLKEWSAKREET